MQITRIADMNEKLKELVKRKETIVKTITEQEKMTAELQKRIDDCWDATELEDIYLPFRPTRFGAAGHSSAHAAGGESQTGCPTVCER